jgi:hypothetical protein
MVVITAIGITTFALSPVLQLAMTVQPTVHMEMCEFIIIVVNLLHISVTFCGYIQGRVFVKDVLEGRADKSTDKIVNFKYVTAYIKIENTDKIINFICILYKCMLKYNKQIQCMSHI